MNDVNSSCAGEPDPEAIPEAFENALTVIQNQTVKLACAISTVKYLLAWSEACDSAARSSAPTRSSARYLSRRPASTGCVD